MADEDLARSMRAVRCAPGGSDVSFGRKLAGVLGHERQVAIALVDVEAVADHEPIGDR